jgi:parallel beta-helix repeat protein
MWESQRNFFLKNNFFNKEYEGIYMKSNLKNNQCYIDNEKNKDLIIKLKEKIIAKDKEISDLKVLKMKKT